MNISLSPEQERFIRDQMESGKYSSANEVVQAALQALQSAEQRERLRQEKLAELQDKMNAGINALQQGQGIDGETALAQLHADILARSQPS